MVDDAPGGREFRSMSPEVHWAICSLGGKTAHANGVAHRFTSAEATEAGKRGGEVVSADRQYMAEIGRRGVAARRRRADPDKDGQP